MIRNLQKWIVIAIGFFLSSGATLCASESEPGVARISLIAGNISTQRGDTGDWAAAAINAPIVRGDRINSGSKSRVELQLDFANILRVAGLSQVRLADLDQKHIQVQISEGLINYSVLKGNQSEIEINTPNVAVRPLKEGVYRIEVNDRSETQVIVRKGEAEVSTSQGTTLVKKGQLIQVRGVDDPEYQLSEAPDKDSWDEWNQDRDQTIKEARSYSYANGYYTGISDMDHYGSWVRLPGYDWVWAPSVDAAWAPYRAGRWIWEPYWGWTWCSYEPWGWAPYHYGRWFSAGGGWYWWPGPCHPTYRPVWAPAYVSFIGFGFGNYNWSFGAGFGYNSIGWIPIGPCDQYYPWWGHGNGYHSVNITNVTNVRNVYNVYNGTRMAPLADSRRYPRISNVENVMNNPRIQKGVTTVSTEDFVRGQNHGRQSPVSASQWKEAQLVAGTIPVVPTKESLNPSTEPARLTTASMRAESVGRYFTRRDPPASLPSFQAQQNAVQQMVQGTSSAGTIPGRAEAMGRASDRSGNPANSLSGQSGVPGNNGTNSAVQPGQTVGTTGVDRGRPARAMTIGTESANGGGSTPPVAQQSVAPVGNSGNPRGSWRRFGNEPSNPTTVVTPPATRTPSANPQVYTVPADHNKPESKPVERLSAPSGNNTPAPSERQRLDRSSSRTETAPVNRGQSQPEPRNSASPAQERVRSMVSPRIETRQAEPPRMEKPQLRIERPMVTERSTPSSNSGGGQRMERSAPSGSQEQKKR
jgi:hypothetical protein